MPWAPSSRCPVVVHPTDLLDGVVQPRRDQHGPEIDPERLFGHPGRAVGRADGREGGDRQDERPERRGERSDGRPFRGHEHGQNTRPDRRTGPRPPGVMADSGHARPRLHPVRRLRPQHRLLRQRPRAARWDPRHGGRRCHRLRHPAGAHVLDRRQQTGDGFRETHIAFRALNRAAVRAFVDAARATGAEVLHEPKVWPEYFATYYGGFVRDPDGNNVEAVCLSPE